ncbi:MAG: hypothetical protein ACRETQ_12680 [Gammaproteobacteria bacterium]
MARANQSKRSPRREHPKRLRRSGAFNQGEVPTIGCFNRSTTTLGVDFDALIIALQEYVDHYVAPVWGTPAKLVKTRGFRRGFWALGFIDSAAAGDGDLLGVHDVTPQGLPYSRVFVRPTLANGERVSVTASHELVEMLVDPAMNLLTTGPDPKAVYAYETADPVEELWFKVCGIPMSNFVYPSYFEEFHKPGTVRFDHMRKIRRPFQVLSGGYQQVFKNGTWRDGLGSKAKLRRFKQQDRRGRRSEQRKRTLSSKTSRQSYLCAGGRIRRPT